MGCRVISTFCFYPGQKIQRSWCGVHKEVSGATSGSLLNFDFTVLKTRGSQDSKPASRSFCEVRNGRRKRFYHDEHTEPIQWRNGVAVEQIFVSSVQKELQAERYALRDFVHGNDLLRQFFRVYEVPHAGRIRGSFLYSHFIVLETQAFADFAASYLRESRRRMKERAARHSCVLRGHRQETAGHACVFLHATVTRCWQNYTNGAGGV